MKPPTFTDGSFGVMYRVCAWCKTPMGKVVCERAMSGRTTHGMCDACIARQLATLPGPARPTLNAAAAAPAGKFPPGIIQPAQGNGTAALAGKMPVPHGLNTASEHPSGSPVAAFIDRLIKRLATWRAR